MKEIDVYNYFPENKINSIQKQEKGFSNDVFVVRTDNGSYVVKECQNILDLEITKALCFTNIVNVYGNVMIQNYVDHDTINFEKDWKLLANSIKKLHEKKVPVNLKGHKDLIRMFVEKCTNYLNDRKKKIIEKIKNKVFIILDEINNTERENLPEVFGFCHNDLQTGNIMKVNDEIIFIDFEYACNGNQLIDIANLFCEFMYDPKECTVTDDKKWPKKEKIAFLKAYFNEEIEGINYSVLINIINSLEYFSHLLWYLWGLFCIKNRQEKNPNFNYCKYSRSRLNFLSVFISEEELSMLREDLN